MPNEQHDHPAAKFGPSKHVVYHQDACEPERANSVAELFRPWIIRQWIDAGKIHREPTPRETPRFELFFDLLYVAVIHQLAEEAIEEPGWPAVVRFVLTFWPSWSIWEEARKYANLSGTDDLLHRFWILIGTTTILGYSANASAVRLDIDERSDHLAVHCAAGFWLVIKMTRVIILLLYAYHLPDFRASQILQAIAVFIPMTIYFPLLWVRTRRTQIALATVGLVMDVVRVDLLAWNLKARWDARMGKKVEVRWWGMPNLRPGIRIPAMNIEHAIERYSAFLVIVLGELVMNLLFTAAKKDLGVSPKFGRAALGMMVAWALNYLSLLPSEPNAEYEHALRRSWLSGICFSFFHWPLVASLLLASAAAGHLVTETQVEWGTRWYWCSGLGSTLLFLCLIDAMHRDLAPRMATKIPRFIRQFINLILAFTLIFCPLTLWVEHLNSLQLLGIGVGATWSLLIINVLGSLPRRGYRGVKLTDEGARVTQQEERDAEAAEERGGEQGEEGDEGEEGEAFI